MLRARKDPHGSRLRLPALAALPNIDKIVELLSNAEANKGAEVELSWMLADGVTPFSLVAIISRSGGEPVWTLTRGKQELAKEIWNYGTRDVGLILNLVLSECMGDTMPSTPTPHTTSIGPGDMGRTNASLAGSYSTSLMGLQQTAGARVPTMQFAKPIKPPAMEGDLQDVQLPNLLQTVTMGQMTGKLLIHNKEQATAELYFVDGNLKHATVLDIKGDGAISELVTWDSGKFFFFKDDRTDQQTVTRRLDALLLEAVTLLDQSQALMVFGLKMDSYVGKKHPNLSERGFEERVAAGAPVNMHLQKQFYLHLDGDITLFEVLRRRPMAKKDWVPIMFNLLSCDLITLSDKPPKTALLESTALDRSAIDGIARQLLRTDTGMMTYPALQYFLEQEFHRYEICASPFSLVLFEMWLRTGDKIEPLPVPAVREAAARINSVKRSIDILAHHEVLNYALVLPQTEAASAAMLAHRILEVLQTGTLGGIRTDSIALAFGIAGLPEDCKDIGILLSAAKASKKAAQRSEFPIVMFKDLKA